MSTSRPPRNSSTQPRESGAGPQSQTWNLTSRIACNAIFRCRLGPAQLVFGFELRPGIKAHGVLILLGAHRRPAESNDTRVLRRAVGHDGSEPLGRPVCVPLFGEPVPRVSALSSASSRQAGSQLRRCKPGPRYRRPGARPAGRRHMGMADSYAFCHHRSCTTGFCTCRHRSDSHSYNTVPFYLQMTSPATNTTPSLSEISLSPRATEGSGSLGVAGSLLLLSPNWKKPIFPIVGGFGIIARSSIS